MSRCFAYPVQGYLGKGRSDVALIESIKLQSGSKLASAEAKKDRKRDKKEKSKEKKGHLKTSLLPEKKIHKSSTGLKIRSLRKLIQTENEQLEWSSLTEEHAKPVGEQKPSTSSDSTQNSSKRKREVSPAPIVKPEQPAIRSNGNVIRIRLSSLKRNAPVVAQPPCSTTCEKAVLPSHKLNDINTRQQPCTTSGRLDLVTSNKWQETQVNVPSVQLLNKPPISVVRPRFEAKSVTRDENETQVDVPSVQLRNNPSTSVVRPRFEANKGSSVSLPKSVPGDENTSHFCLLPHNKLPEVALPPKEVCSSSGELKSIAHIEDVEVRELPKGALPPGVPKAIAPEDDIPVRDPISLNKKMVKVDLKYQDLFFNWVPPPTQLKVDFDDQDWLFSKKKNPDNQTDKKPKSNSSLPSCANVSLWPRARLIPEADIYALPFTLPF